jgi:hypothetical protein
MTIRFASKQLVDNHLLHILSIISQLYVFLELKLLLLLLLLLFSVLKNLCINKWLKIE